LPSGPGATWSAQPARRADPVRRTVAPGPAKRRGRPPRQTLQDREALVAELEAAEQKHREAIAAVARVADAESARDVEALFVKPADVTKHLDMASEAFIKCAAAYAEPTTAINAAGCPYPSGQQVRIVFERCLQTLIVECPWSKTFTGRHPAPNERVRSMKTIVEQWRNGPAGGWINERLEPQTEAAE